MTFTFAVPLQPCCVVLYLPSWQTLFELLPGSQFPFVSCLRHTASCSLLCSSSYIVMSSDVLLSILMLSLRTSACSARWWRRKSSSSFAGGRAPVK